MHRHILYFQTGQYGSGDDVRDAIDFDCILSNSLKSKFEIAKVNMPVLMSVYRLHALYIYVLHLSVQVVSNSWCLSPS